MLFYIQAVDRLGEQVSRDVYAAIIAEPNLSTTRKLVGLLPVFVGMEMTLEHTLLPPRYVPGTVGTVVGIELDGNEPE